MEINMAKLANVFAQFQGHEPKTATVGDFEIKYRTLTIAESDGFQKRTVKGFDSDGKPQFNFNEISKIRYEKVSMGLIEPKITVKELEAMEADASKTIIEIEALISGTEDTTDEEGN